MARQAGEIQRAGFGQKNQIYYKGVIDLVTDVDRRSEDFIVGEIRRRFPNHRIITEESGIVAGEECCIWYIDPLDGTVNFAHGVPIFSVSIAYAEEGVVCIGAVYDPMQDECFSAELGQGAQLNGKPIHVSNTKELIKSLLTTGFPYDIRTNPQNNLELFARFSMLTQGVRRLGSAALDLSYVAAGRLDGFWETSLQTYDIAAGGLIALEAGALVTNLHGHSDYLKPPCSILAANPHLHALMREVIHSTG